MVWSSLGMGGTEKAAVLYAGELIRRGYQVLYVSDAPGPRLEQCHQSKVPVRIAADPLPGLEAIINDFQPDIIHQHVPGYAMGGELYKVLSKSNTGNKRVPPVIETNVFGRLDDPESRPWVKARMFVSATSATQAYRRARLPLDAASVRNAAVLGNPLDEMAPTAPSQQQALRESLGVRAGECLVLRVGRNSPGKWTNWECEAFAKAHRQDARLRLLLMEPPNELWQRVEENHYGPGVILQHQTTDFEWLRLLYQSADLMLHASAFGESFGYTIAEAMQANMPVIVRTTPFGDNAQVELVENGVTGWVCGSIGEMARRLVDLAKNKSARTAMGMAGNERITRMTNLESNTEILEAVIQNVLTGQPPPLLQKQHREIIAYSREFSEREWRLSEGLWSHPAEHLGYHAYSAYRQARVKLSPLRKRLGI